jgi:hypothetical protein
VTVSSDTQLARFLAALRTRAQRRATWSLLGWGAALLGGALLLVLIGAAVAPSWIWRTVTFLGGAVGVIAAGTALARSRRLLADEAQLAQLVRARMPGLGDDLWSALELGRELPKLDANPILSGDLVRLLRANVGARLAEIDPARIIDLAPARKLAWQRVGVVALAWAAIALVRPSLLTRGWHELKSGADERLTTSAEPIVGDVRVELTYPAYTGLGTRTIPGLSGQLLALPGTVVKLEARALVPARGSAELVVTEDGKSSHNRPVEVKGQALSTSFTVKRAGSFRFVLGGGLRKIREPNEHRVEIDPDRPPRVDLYTPGDPLELAGPRRIELAYSVDDDYGLGDLELVWRVQDGPEAKKLVLARPAGQRAASGKFEWDLAELDLAPGARVAYHLEARDNDDISGPNVGKSRTYYLFVSSPREKHEKAVGSEEQLLEAAVIQLADRLEVRAQDLAEALAPIHNRAETLLMLLSQAEQNAEADKPGGDAKKQLAEMHARLAKLVRDEESQLAEVRKRKPPKPHTLSDGNNKLILELERDVIQLDDLLGKQRLEELLRVGDEMAQARDRLKQLMEQYKKSRSDAVKKDIEREMRELERKLAELQKKAAQLAHELPDQFLNKDAMGKNDLQSRLDKMREMMQRGDIDGAMAELERLSSSLDKMMSSMEGDLRDYRRDRFTDEDKKLAELEDKVNDLEHDEKQLKNETEQIRQRTRAEAQRQMRDKVEPFQKRAREKVAQIKKHADQVDRGVLSVWEQEELARLKERVNNLDRMLSEGDLDEARNAARLTERSLGALGGDLADDEARAWRGAKPALKKSREHMEEGQKIAKQLQDELNQLMPRPDQLMSPEDQKRMPELAQRQKATRQRAGDVQREIEQMSKKEGRLPQRLGEGLKQAGQHMDRAAEKLRQHDARDAEGEEEQALQQLGEMKKQLQEQRRPRDQQQQGRMDKEPVKIPGADEYKAPREFRQDLLEAMKRNAPAEYKDQVKRYYEELVK